MFWFLQLLLVFALVMQVTAVYLMIKKDSFKNLASYGLTSQTSNLFVSYAILFLLIDAVLRIRSCASGELAI